VRPGKSKVAKRSAAAGAARWGVSLNMYSSGSGDSCTDASRDSRGDAEVFRDRTDLRASSMASWGASVLGRGLKRTYEMAGCGGSVNLDSSRESRAWTALAMVGGRALFGNCRLWVIFARVVGFSFFQSCPSPPQPALPFPAPSTPKQKYSTLIMAAYCASQTSVAGSQPSTTSLAK